MAIPNWLQPGTDPYGYFDPTSGQVAKSQVAGYVPFYVDPTSEQYNTYWDNPSDPRMNDPSVYSSSDYYYAPSTDAEQQYWWTGGGAVPGSYAPGEDWTPIYTTGLFNPEAYWNWLNPLYNEDIELPGPIVGTGGIDPRTLMGISIGDPYSLDLGTVPAELPYANYVDWGNISPTLAQEIISSPNPPNLALPENFEWGYNQSKMVWEPQYNPGINLMPSPEVDMEVPGSYWNTIDAKVNEWNEILRDAFTNLDLDFTEEQQIIDALSAKILGLRTPDLTGSYATIDDLIAQIEASGTSPEIKAALEALKTGPSQNDAFDFVAKSFGFADNEEGTAQENYMAWLAEQRGLTRADMQGLSDQEKAEYDKIMRLDMQDAERRSQAQMEAVFADTGSAIRYMAAADEANQQMVNMQSRYRADQKNQDVMLQSQALDRQMEMYMGMVQQGQMSALQFMDMQQRGNEALLNGYLNAAQLELSALTGALGGEMGRANLQLSESANDRALLETQYTSVYNGILAKTGINMGILETLNTAWDTQMKPILDGLNALLAKENLSAQDYTQALEWQALLIEQGAQDFEEKWGWTNLIPNITIGI